MKAHSIKDWEAEEGLCSLRERKTTFLPSSPPRRKLPGAVFPVRS